MLSVSVLNLLLPKSTLINRYLVGYLISHINGRNRSFNDSSENSVSGSWNCVEYVIIFKEILILLGLLIKVRRCMFYNIV